MNTGEKQMYAEPRVQAGTSSFSLNQCERALTMLEMARENGDGG